VHREAGGVEQVVRVAEQVDFLNIPISSVRRAILKDSSDASAPGNADADQLRNCPTSVGILRLFPKQ
jgi:hypothetical protein